MMGGSGPGSAKGGIGGTGILPGGPVGGVSGTSRLESLASGAGKGMQAAGQGVSAAGSAAGTGIKAASSAANVIPGAGQAIAAAGAAVGTGVEAAGKVAGKGLEAAGKATEGAGKAAGKATEAAGKAVGKAESVVKGAGETAARFAPDGKAANAGVTTGAGDAVRSATELGKANAPMSLEAGLSSAQTGVGATPGGNGFASATSFAGVGADAPAASSTMDASAAQRQFEKDNAPQEKGRSMADKLNDGAQSLQHEANRRKPGLSHDGQSGGVSIRMNHID